MGHTPEYHERRKAHVRKRISELRAQRKEAKQCIRCGCQDERTLNGRVMCKPCAIKWSEYCYELSHGQHRRKPKTDI